MIHQHPLQGAKSSFRCHVCGIDVFFAEEKSKTKAVHGANALNSDFVTLFFSEFVQKHLTILVLLLDDVLPVYLAFQRLQLAQELLK